MLKQMKHFDRMSKQIDESCWENPRQLENQPSQKSVLLKVARYSFSGLIPPTFERKLSRHKQRFGKSDTTVVLGEDEILL